MEVLVGPKQRIYRYHALISACHSVYIDTILSSPAAVKNQKEQRVEFPDVDEETWEKKMFFLEPGDFNTEGQLEDLAQVLPFYDKYQFIDGLRLVDGVISKMLGDSLRGRYTIRGSSESTSAVVVLAWELNLPKSNHLAVAWAGKSLKKLVHLNEETISVLLPLVENDDTVLTALVKTIKERLYKEMTIEEMREVTKRDSFPKEIMLKTK